MQYNAVIIGDEPKGELIDVDELVESSTKQHSTPEETVLKDEPASKQDLNMVVAGKRTKPSWGGKIAPQKLSLFAEDDTQFNCGR